MNNELAEIIKEQAAEIVALKAENTKLKRVLKKKIYHRHWRLWSRVAGLRTE